MRKLTVIFFFFPFTASLAQSADVPANSFSTRQDSLLNTYYSLRDSLSLYNGRQFYGYPTSIEGYAYYGSNDLMPGSVLYNDVWYHQVGMFYDIYKDELIVRHPPPFEVNVILFREKVSQFVLDGQTFVYVGRDKNSVMENGFYQQLIAGKATLLVKRQKLLEEKVNGLQVEARFIAKNHFFILKDGVYRTIRKEDDLMSVLKDRRQELYQYKSSKRLRYKSNPELFIMIITNYYNQLQQ
ncbi:MAG TPA: hypothetical protein VFI06_11875 [Chitinophagaceae bacterium]|nr:hypothetical protein [Chitinophagaceae bacterium]